MYASRRNSPAHAQKTDGVSTRSAVKTKGYCLKNVIRTISVLSAALVACVATSTAQSSASADASIDTKIVAGITLSKSQDLQFGSVVRSANGGTVTISPNTEQASYSGVTRGQNFTYNAASFASTGEPEYQYSIGLPKSVTLTRKGGSQTMSVNSFTYSTGAGQLDNQGGASFKVGATLNVDGNQTTGAYAGTFTVMVEYQ